MKYKITKSYYQSKEKFCDNSFVLNPILYKRTIYTIKDYPRFVSEFHGEISYPRDCDISHNSPTEEVAINKVNNVYRKEAIERALKQIPKEYQQMVFDHIVYDKTYLELDYAHENTLKKYTQAFVYFVARELGEI